MSNVRRVYVEKKPDFAVKAKELKHEIKHYLGITTVEAVRVLIRYDVENISEETYKKALYTVFSEPPVDDIYEETFDYGDAKVFTVEFLPGQFDQRADSAEQCVKLLEQRKVDLIVTNFPNSHLNHSYRQKTICNFSDVFVANPNYFKLRKQEIAFSELNKYPIMMLDRNSTTSEFLHNLFLQHQLDLIPEIELSSNDLLIDLAKIGLGIAFVPDYCINHENKELFVLKTKEKMPPRQIVVSVNTTMPVSASTEEFLNLLPEVGN